MKKIGICLLALLAFSVVGVVSCEDPSSQREEAPEIVFQTDLLKQISFVESVGDASGGIIITLYEYDKQGRITKESTPRYEEGTSIFEEGNIVGVSHYIDYFYNNKGQLEKKVYYSSNVYAGFSNLQTWIYTYDKDGKLIKAIGEYPLLSEATSFTDYECYSYDGNRLIRKDYSWIGRSGYVTTYEYNARGELIREINRFEEDEPHEIIEHSHENGLQVKTEYFIGSTGEKTREIKRYFDEQNNLIYLESNELMRYSSRLSFVHKYDYY